MHDHRVLDLATWVSAGIAAASFWHGVALTVTIIAGLVSAACGLVRLHDRFKYGSKA